MYMVEGVESGARGVERLALDMKVINALGAGHFVDTLEGPLVAAGRYRETACSRANIWQRCADKGVQYEPLVFTAQGGCERHVEAILTQIATSVAENEGREKGRVKSEMLESLSMCISKSVAKAVLRRRHRRCQQPCFASETLLAELALLHEPEDEL